MRGISWVANYLLLSIDAHLGGIVIFGYAVPSRPGTNCLVHGQWWTDRNMVSLLFFAYFYAIDDNFRVEQKI